MTLSESFFFRNSLWWLGAGWVRALWAAWGVRTGSQWSSKELDWYQPLGWVPCRHNHLDGSALAELVFRWCAHWQEKCSEEEDVRRRGYSPRPGHFWGCHVCFLVIYRSQFHQVKHWPPHYGCSVLVSVDEEPGQVAATCQTPSIRQKELELWSEWPGLQFLSTPSLQANPAFRDHSRPSSWFCAFSESW